MEDLQRWLSAQLNSPVVQLALTLGIVLGRLLHHLLNASQKRRRARKKRPRATA